MKKKMNSKDQIEISRSDILIVHEDEKIRDYLGNLLAKKYNTLLASNQKDALKLLKKSPSIVIINDNMSELDGFDLVRRIRLVSEVKNLHIIMLIENTSKGWRNKVFEAGADAYIVKPICEQELFTYVRRFLEIENTKNEKKEKALSHENYYSTILNSIDEGFCIIEVIFDEYNKPVDYCFLEVNLAFEKVSGIINPKGKRMREIAPNHEDYWFDIYGKVALSGEPVRFENRAEQLQRWYDVYAFQVGQIEKHQVAVLFNDITWRKNNEEKLRRTKEQYDLLFNSVKEGFANYKAIYDEKGILVDLLVLEINPAGAKLTGVEREYQIGKTWKEVWTGIEDHLFDIYREIDKNGGSYSFEHFSGITYRWYTNNIYKIAQDQFAVTFVDITESKVAQEKLLIREAQLDAFFANSPAILNLVDENFCYINTDKLTPTYYGLNRESIKGKCLEDLSQDFLKTTGEVMRVVLESGEPILDKLLESPLPGDKGEIAYWRASFFRVPLGTQEWGIGVISTEVTDIKRTEIKLRESRERLKAIFENMEEGLVTVEPEEGTLEQNPAAVRIYGYNNIESKVEFFLKENRSFEVTTMDGKILEPDHWPVTRMLRGEIFRDYSLYLYNKDQGWKKLLLYSGKLINDSTGKPLIGFLSIRDITLQKKAEEDLKEAYKSIEERLKEKEVLLREIYHRTKNTLQLISSMLSLKGSVMNNPEVISIFEDTQDRIKAIALVHEKLYKGQNLSKVNLRDYITSLANLLIENHLMKNNITLNLELEELYLLIDSVIPCGLILTELITNTIKHAFPGGRKGQIEIKLRRLKDGVIELIVADNGVGLKLSDQNIEGKLGIQLLKGIAEDQLSGTITLNTDIGVEWTIRFKDTLYQERI